MKVKVFRIRLGEEVQEQDQKTVNDFLSEVEMVHTDSVLVADRCAYWTLLIIYAEKTDEGFSSRAAHNSRYN